MYVKKTLLGISGKKEVFLYTLDNKKGLKAEIINYGGIIKRLEYKDIDVVLGFDNFNDYLDNYGYFGAIIGRNSNRIEDSRFTIDSTEYKLNANDKNNNLHGGILSFDKKIWDVKILNSNEPAITLFGISYDNEEGFPGTVKVNVTYTLTSYNSLKISYHAISDKDTVINLTNHSYFNLNGHNSGDVYSHKLWLNSLFYTPNSKECLPYGEILSVKDTPFDFTKEKELNLSIKSQDKQISMFGGLDHNFALFGRGYRKCAALTGDITGIKMNMYTDRPAVQVYTANHIKTDRVYKDKSRYKVHGGICLETQAFPNNLKFSHFPYSVIKKGEVYETKTEYKFI
ncbi:MAG: galactose mutarotase [Ruminococcaceae bacterium]|nr:galactose mutarotase [Oscillospiraceae bacterium]